MSPFKNNFPGIFGHAQTIGERSLKRFKNLFPYLLSAGFSLFIFEIHMLGEVDSMLNERNTVLSNGFLTSQITYHKEFAPFARRPLTTLLIETTSNWSGITLGKAFVWVNFCLLALAGILLFRLSRKMGSGYGNGILNILFFFGSFSVLFAFFPPIYSYDEPLQYCLVFAGLTCLLQRQWAGYVLWFSVAMVARENTAILIPGLMVIVTGLRFSDRNTFLVGRKMDYLLTGLPLLFYMVYLLFFISLNGLWAPAQMELHERLSSINENFGNVQNSIETLVSMFLTLGVSIYFIFGSFGHNPGAIEKRLKQAFILSCSLNITIVLFTALAREARLFSLPLVFLWPIMAQYCSREIPLLLSHRVYLGCFSQIRYIVSFSLLTFLNYIVSFTVYQPSMHPAYNYFNEYLFISLFLMYLHYLLKHYTNRNPLEIMPFPKKGQGFG